MVIKRGLPYKTGQTSLLSIKETVVSIARITQRIRFIHTKHACLIYPRAFFAIGDRFSRIWGDNRTPWIDRHIAVSYTEYIKTAFRRYESSIPIL